MATVNYEFADGHFAEVECTEEFKREYEFLLVKEKSLNWKEMKQKKRAGFRAVKDLSLDKFMEDGFDIPTKEPGPLEKLIKKEEQQERRKLLSILTDKQYAVYFLHRKGLSKVSIAKLLEIDERSVRRRLECAENKLLKSFLKNSRFCPFFVHGYIEG